MDISIAICTWNRSALLRQTLTQMQNLRVPDGVVWELIVVNNNCTDDTDEVVKQAAAGLPVRLIHEPEPGLSRARNRAVDEAMADWLIFTDDDVLVDERWLVAYSAAIQEVGDDVAFLGGEVRPWFEEEPEAELCEAIPTVGNGFCGVTVPDNLEIAGPLDRQPMGANFGVRRSLLSGCRFDPSLGVNGASRISSEERQLIYSLLSQGLTGRWVSGAGVSHFVPRERIRLRYLMRHIFGLGQTSVIGEGKPLARSVCGVPAWAIREIVESSICLPVNFLLRRRTAFYRDFSRLCSRSGIVWQCLHERGRRDN